MKNFLSVLALAVMATGAATATAVAEGRVSVPEPSSIALLASGMGVVYVVRKLRRKQ